MPIITVKVTKEGVTTEHKREIIHGATQLMVDILNKPPEATFIVIEEVDTDNWGIGYEQVTQLRKAQSNLDCQ
ncbi:MULTISPECIES: tautomerase family protein [unclassified Pseudoalteromonas]|uniref:tautomerase family protein n=1 Tax=unclassified Pseudoalteromonas TaxID=194690 RepID=UPI0030143C10